MSTGGAGPSHFPEENRQYPRPQQVKLTKEEIEVLRECNRESFWYRCSIHMSTDCAQMKDDLITTKEMNYEATGVPLGATFATLTHIAVIRGIIKPGARYGSVGKCLGAAFVGYLAGKISYQSTCREKIMRLENSPLAQAMRAGKRGTEVMHEVAMQEMTGQGYPAPSSQDSKTGVDYHSKLDIDTDRNVSYQGLDDSQRPSLDREQGLIESTPGGQSLITYDELRRQNRAQYSEKRAHIADEREQARLEQALPPISSDIDLPPPPSSTSMYSSGLGSPKDEIKTNTDSSKKPKKRIKTNQYGDIIEE